MQRNVHGHAKTHLEHVVKKTSVSCQSWKKGLSGKEGEVHKRSPETCRFLDHLTAPLSLQCTNPNPAVYLNCKKQGANHYPQQSVQSPETAAAAACGHRMDVLHSSEALFFILIEFSDWLRVSKWSFQQRFCVHVCLDFVLTGSHSYKGLRTLESLESLSCGSSCSKKLVTDLESLMEWMFSHFLSGLLSSCFSFCSG